MKSVFEEVVEKLDKKGIHVFLDGPSIVYVHKKTGYKLVEFIDGLGPSAERLALESELKQAVKDAQRLVTTPLNQNQLGALASFISHIGVDNFASSEVCFALNEAKYDKSYFVDKGIAHNDLFFIDGSTPPDNIVEDFMAVCDDHFSKPDCGAIAIHCKAGLGRTGTLIGLWAMREH